MFIVNVSILASENSEWNNIWPTKSNALDVEFTHAGQKTKQCLMHVYIFIPKFAYYRNYKINK